MTTPPAFDENYQSVTERIHLFRDKYPEGTLTALDNSKPFEIVTVEGQSYVAVAAVAKRTPEDPAGGMGLAWCPLPGYDEYTMNSEIQNAQTSAWGRAIIAVLAADSTKIASKEEVRSAQSHRNAPAAAPPRSPAAAAVAAVVTPHAAEANGTGITPDAAPDSTDPSQEEYNAAVISESMRLMNDPSTPFEALRDVWQVLTQARLSARRVAPPAGMEPDGDGMVPIGSAVAFVGKERKLAAEAQAAAPAEVAPPAEQPAPTEEAEAQPVLVPADEAKPAPVKRAARKAAVPSV